MPQFNKKWYNTWWFKITVASIIIIILYFATRKTIVYMNYQEYLKTQIDSLNIENTKLDSLYKVAVLQKDKIKIIREKVSIQSEVDKLERLKIELELLGKQPSKITDSITPEDLLRYFKKELK